LFIVYKDDIGITADSNDSKKAWPSLSVLVPLPIRQHWDYSRFQQQQENVTFFIYSCFIAHKDDIVITADSNDSKKAWSSLSILVHCP